MEERIQEQATLKLRFYYRNRSLLTGFVDPHKIIQSWTNASIIHHLYKDK